MSDTLTSIDRLLEKSNELKNGPERIGVLEEAVRLADEQEDLDAGFRARLELIDSAAFGGRPDILLSAFAWCLAQHDSDPDRFPCNDLLWKYKWVVGHVTEFPDIPRAQIEAMLDDMARRFTEAGSTLHAVFQARRETLAAFGEIDAANRATADIATSKRDWLSDCRACVYDGSAGFYAEQQMDAKALAEAAPILAGRAKCTHVPHRTYGQLLLPLLRLGRADEAREYHEVGVHMIGDDPEFLSAAGLHLEYLAMTGELDEAIDLMQMHLPNAVATPSVFNRMRFYWSAWLLFVTLFEQAERTVRLRLPADFPLADARGSYEVAALMEWFGKEVRSLATQFDARNGNDYYQRWAARRWR
ncbi:MAG TPA: hypothetical protein VFE62_22885 [Gemmataceae bacterium]|nr:hypothetical protein [Gemmataceae bacterium]